MLSKARLGSSLEKLRLRDQQKERMQRLATREVAQDLRKSGFVPGRKRVHGAVVFTDVRGFKAVEMIETMEFFNLQRAATDKPQIRIGIGIASGGMVVRCAGTHERVSCTRIGDAVDPASKLEARTGIAGRNVRIDGATRATSGDRVEGALQGPVPIRGKAERAEVFSVSLGQNLRWSKETPCS